MKPCPNCGSNDFQEEQLWGYNFYPYTNSFGYCYKCNQCRFRSEPKGTKNAAKKTWEQGKGHVFQTIPQSPKLNLFRWLKDAIRRKQK